MESVEAGRFPRRDARIIFGWGASCMQICLIAAIPLSTRGKAAILRENKMKEIEMGQKKDRGSRIREVN